MKILVVNSSERGGGAEQSAADLVQAYRRRGHQVRHLVGRRRGAAADGLEEAEIAGGRFARPLLALEQRVRRRAPFRGQARLSQLLHALALPARAAAWWRGEDLFHNPASFQLADGPPEQRPDVIHLHNLHGDYFDLRALPTLSRRVPLVWTLHDAWALSGHCAYAVDCRRWQHGCGACPDLLRAPAVRRDATADNWRQRRRIAAQCRLPIAVPSRWLLSQLQQSIWQHQPARVIANGVDLRLFRPGDRAAARGALGLPADAFVIVFNAAHAAGRSSYKDPLTVQSTLRQLQRRAPDINWHLVAIGHQPPMDGVTQLHQTGYLHDREQIARVYHAGDVLLHAAHAENHPLVVLEALASGLPVAATAVGGIGEQVEDGVSGVLAPRGAAGLLARRLIEVARQPRLRAAMAEQALQRARRDFSLDDQAAAYLDWFTELIAQRNTRSAEAAC